MQQDQKLFTALFLTVTAVVVSGILLYQHFPFGTEVQEKTVASVQPKESKYVYRYGEELYAMPAEARNAFLYQMNDEEEYQIVIEATDDGIENYRETVWDDIDFWTHRGFALFKVGDCAEAGAASYHVLMRDEDNEIAAAIMGSIGQNPRCLEAN